MSTVTAIRLGPAHRRAGSLLDPGDVHRHLSRAPDFLEPGRFPLRDSGLHWPHLLSRLDGKVLVDPQVVRHGQRSGCAEQRSETSPKAAALRLLPATGAVREELCGHCSSGDQKFTAPRALVNGCTIGCSTGIAVRPRDYFAVSAGSIIRWRRSGSQHHSSHFIEWPSGGFYRPSVPQWHPFVPRWLTRRTDPCSVTGRCPFRFREKCGSQEGRPRRNQ